MYKIREVPRIESIKVTNFRALENVTIGSSSFPITPLTIFLGRNGSGKSTIFDVFAFLSDCFTSGLRKAVDDRGRFRELRTRGKTGPIIIELKYREAKKENKKQSLMTYHIEIDEKNYSPFVAKEWLQWRRFGKYGSPFKFLNFTNGSGDVISGESPDIKDKKINESLDSPDMIAVNTLGQLKSHPRISSLRRFITGWYLSYLTADNTRTTPESGPQEKLSKTGDNLPNVIQFLKEQNPETLQKIHQKLSDRIPKLEKVDNEMTRDGRLLLQIKDAPFDEPILSKFASDGTLKMLSYLTVLNDPNPSPLIGIEEPENHLHPRLLTELAEECREASVQSQLLVSTHSPYFLNAVKPQEVWILNRNLAGYTKATRVSDIQGVSEFIEEGASLGDLWMEGYLNEENV